MWLPTPIYERIPQFWLLLGLLFMSSGTYLGFDYSLSFVYFGVGFVCCIWSLWIFSMRLRSRKDQRQHPILEKPEDQQAEDVDAGAEPAA
jgi:cbb3-type cytochrome oxidase subunit 3